MATETKKKTAAPKAEKAPKAPKTTTPKVAAPAVAAIHRRKELTGAVVSNKMQKTIVVKIERQVRHGLYGKYISRSTKFKAHDEKNEAKIGDIVTVVESRPLSKDKRWALQKIVRRAIQTAEANV
ncbi:MAG: 30S ribosomal protein S17 [Bdellovibrionales bacterium]|nr:30S ribosomal protein S17 [Bdellovibrionales bacterium]